MADELLLRGPKPGLWHSDLRNEVLRFLNKTGSSLPEDLRSRIVRAVHQGPAKGPKSEGALSDTVRREKIARLLELHLSGAVLDERSLLLLAGTEPASELDFDQRYHVFSPTAGIAARASGIEEGPQDYSELATTLASDSQERPVANRAVATASLAPVRNA